MKYTIFNLKTNEYLSHYKEDEIEWTKNIDSAKQMSYNELENMYDYIKKENPNLKIKIKTI